MANVKNYAVYRIDPLTDEKVRIGTLTERREKERINNELGMLRLARRLYSGLFFDRFRISISLL